jgi:hypothetical protein
LEYLGSFDNFETAKLVRDFYEKKVHYRIEWIKCDMFIFALGEYILVHINALVFVMKFFLFCFAM